MCALAIECLSNDPTVIFDCNLSAENLASSDAWNRVLYPIRASSDLPSRPMLDLIETRPLDEPKRATIILAEARKPGGRAVLDDFGTGSASLRLAQQIDADIIKIDKAFALDARPSLDRNDSLRHLVGFISNCAPVIVLKGLETIEQDSMAHAAEPTPFRGLARSSGRRPAAHHTEKAHTVKQR